MYSVVLTYLDELKCGPLFLAVGYAAAKSGAFKFPGRDSSGSLN